MKKDIVIELKNVHESYDVDLILDGKSSREKFLALRDINISVEKGECIAIIGPNGAGKSTILRLLAGLIKPDNGEIKVIGRIGSLLDLGAGFHPEMTGRDNLFLNASLYNLGKDMIDSRLSGILKFADIGMFIDAPLKCYSQGMYVRLAFSLAINVDPDILLVDDCLAVGDEAFQIKCIDKVLELKEKNTTIIFVTHDINLAKKVCNRAIFIKNGVVVKDASVDEAAAFYSKPFDVDVNVYKYLGRRILDETRRQQEDERKRFEAARKEQEAERKRQDEEHQRQAESRKQQEEENKKLVAMIKQQEDFLKKHETVIRKQEEDLRKQAEEYRKREEEFRKQDELRRWKEDAYKKLETVVKQQDAARRDLEAVRKKQDETLKMKDEELKKQEAAFLKQEIVLKEQDEALRKIDQARIERETEQKVQREVERVKQQERDRRNVWKMFIAKGPLSLRFERRNIDIFYENTELTTVPGLTVSFTVEGVEYDFSNVRSRIVKLSDTEWVYYLKWRQPRAVMLVFKIRIIDENEIGLEIVFQTGPGTVIRNQRVELGLSNHYQPLDIDPRNSKSIALKAKGKHDLCFVSSLERQISGCHPNMTGGPSLYFVTVPDRELYNPPVRKSRGIVFKGSILIDKEAPARKSDALLEQSLERGGLKAVFKDGYIDLMWHGRRLTECFGFYSSIYSKGVWYDSTQARWEIKRAREYELVAEGFWPWIPVSQVWRIDFSKSDMLGLHVEMQVYESMEINIQETAIMLSPEYTKWSDGNKDEDFPPEYTRDDVFRYCLWSHDPDGLIALKMKSPALPAVLFQPGLLEQFKLVLENSAHIYATRSRLVHCMRLNQAGKSRVNPGTYDLFKGQITVREDKQ